MVSILRPQVVVLWVIVCVFCFGVIILSYWVSRWLTGNEGQVLGFFAFLIIAFFFCVPAYLAVKALIRVRFHQYVDLKWAEEKIGSKYALAISMWLLSLLMGTALLVALLRTLVIFEAYLWTGGAVVVLATSAASLPYVIFFVSLLNKGKIKSSNSNSGDMV